MAAAAPLHEMIVRQRLPDLWNEIPLYITYICILLLHPVHFSSVTLMLCCLHEHVVYRAMQSVKLTGPYTHVEPDLPRLSMPGMLNLSFSAVVIVRTQLS